MELTIDELQIEIQASSASAASGVDALASSLSRLKSAVKGGAGLTAVSKQLEAFSAAVSKMTVPSQKIKDLVMALTPLETIGKSKLGATLNQLKKIPEITAQLDDAKLSAFADKIKQVTAAVAPLAAEMEKVSQGFSKLPASLQRAINANTKLTHSNTRLGSSFSGINLAAFLTNLRYLAGALRGVARTVADWISESNSYIENLNLFTVAMGAYAKSAKDYAEQVGELMGIDPSEWMRNQGVFMTLLTGFGVAGEQAALMSKNLTQLGYDLSSFFNISFADAMQKLQSGISGELEPLRRLGYDLSQAELKQIAFNLGIEKNISDMTQAEKAQLRYYAVLTQVTTAQGDMKRTLDAPANQLRILSAQATQAARALGNIFIPALNAVLPYAIAFLKVVRWLAQDLAVLVGFTLPEVDYSGITDGANNATDAIDETTEAIGSLKSAVLGIDELNVLSSGPTLSDVKSDLGFKLPEYDFISGLTESKASEIFKKWKEDLQPLADLLSNMTLTFKDVFFKWDNLTVGDIIKKIVVGLGTITGAMIGWSVGGLGGAVIGAVIGTSLGLAMASMLPDFNNLSAKDIPGLIADALAAAIGFGVGVAIGGFAGGLLLMTISLGLTLIAQKIDWENMSTAGKVGVAAAGLAVLGGAIYGVYQKTKRLSGAFDEKNQKLGRQNELEQTATEKLPALASKLAAAAGASALAANQFGALNGVFSGMPSYAGEAQGAFANVNQSLSALRDSAAQTNNAFFEVTGGIQSGASQINDAAQGVADNTVAVQSKLESSLSQIGTSFSNFGTELVNGMSNLSHNSGVLGANLQNSFADAFNQIGDGFTSWGNSFLQGFAKFGNSLGNMAAQTANSMGQTLTEGFSGIWNSFTSLMKSMGENVSGWWSQNWKTVTIATAITAAVVGAIALAPATGGASLLPLAAFADGGFPVAGQMFIANEGGIAPEMVGTIGNRTAVANNDQIVEAVSAGVYEAVVSAMARSGGNDQSLKLYIDGRQVNASVKKTQRDQGAGIMTGGILYNT